LIGNLPNAVSAAAAAAYSSAGVCRAAAACFGRHLANRNEMRVSGSDSYALLFSFIARALRS